MILLSSAPKTTLIGIVISAISFSLDKLFITNRRLIFANVQGITGKKTEFTTIPFSKIEQKVNDFLSLVLHM